ncbi:Hypothetical Protein RSKD131_3259 [Cereibacter sphaeroides KD131]|nr:Hypothetical Protein RSKD131_3259 [Cereibacter sphaeroides KD131]
MQGRPLPGRGGDVDRIAAIECVAARAGHGTGAADRPAAAPA